MFYMGAYNSKQINKNNSIQVITNIEFCNICNIKLLNNKKNKNICNYCKEEIVLKRLKNIGFI